MDNEITVMRLNTNRWLCCAVQKWIKHDLEEKYTYENKLISKFSTKTKALQLTSLQYEKSIADITMGTGNYDHIQVTSSKVVIPYK